jgi:hypothetical protein
MIMANLCISWTLKVTRLNFENRRQYFYANGRKNDEIAIHFIFKPSPGILANTGALYNTMKKRGRLYVISCGSGGSSAAGPVGMEEFATGLINTLVGMGTKVIALSLQQIGGQALGAIAVKIGQR